VGPPICGDANQSPVRSAASGIQLTVWLWFLKFPPCTPLLLLSLFEGSSRSSPGEHTRIPRSQPEQRDDTKKLGDPEYPAVLTVLFREAQSSRDNMMSAIETGVYQPAQLLSWVYMSLQDTQGSAFDGFKIDSDTSQDVNKRSAADLSSNYLNNFFHLNSEVA